VEKALMPQIDRQFVTKTLQQLVRINSVNPKLDPAAPGEEEIGLFITQILKDLNLEPEIHPLEPGRVNITSVIKGRGNGSSLMINGHMDTVGIQDMENPFSGNISGGRIFGRGAMDMKGGIAAAVGMIKALIESNIRLKGDLILAFVADEEYGSIGTEDLVKTHRADAALVTEPTGLNVCLAHKGFGLFEITTTGKSAHGSRPEEGIDANMHMGWIMNGLDRLSRNLQDGPPHALLGRPSLHIPVIKGGTEPFTYAGKCRMNVERRTIPGETRTEILAEIHTLLQSISAQNPDFDAKVKTIMWRDAYEADKKHKLVSAVNQSVEAVTGRAPAVIGHPWWEDSGILAQAGIQTVIIGPEGSGLHTKDEWVDIQSVIDLAGILLHTALSFCNSDGGAL
jgi:acetylornithine deacetylase